MSTYFDALIINSGIMLRHPLTYFLIRGNVSDDNKAPERFYVMRSLWNYVFMIKGV